MSKLMASVAGVRGIVGDTFTPDVIVKYIAAFSKFCKPGKIIVGRDTRPSGKVISDIVCSVLNMCGRDVIDLDIATTPTVAMGIKLYEAAGGIAITASHNPSEWNALKFMNYDTLFLNEEQGAQLNIFLNQDNPKYVGFEEIGKTELIIEEARKYHIQQVLDIPYINKSDIRKKNFKVAIDCVNGAGSVILADLLIDLGCSVAKINCTPNGIFPHGAEPLPENLTEICEFIKDGNFDIGMVVDPDSDRLALISDAGVPLGEEYTLAMVADLLLEKINTDIVINVSTSRVVEDIATKNYKKTFRTKVGEINVSTEMLKRDCKIGGEGNGGIILPEIHPGRDALVGAGLILQYLYEKNDFVTNLFNKLPQYVIVKDKISVENIDFDERMEKILEDEDLKNINDIDGIKIDHEDYWVQLRKSNTEPIVRIFAEAKTKEKADEIVKIYKDKLIG
ncbi:MAG: phosphoglucosamine mutase [Candidatus Delongbacteria bacterium]|jgi:phosphomannomutase|nr:phosphoglucosamine mutase [Candidatus Delongbacteria bacterium]